MRFLNKVVIVTGGSSGIGAATAILFAKEGADVVIVGRNETKLNQVAAEIHKFYGKKALVITADLTKDEDAKQIITKTIYKFGKISILVNNAGVSKFAGLEDENLIQAFDTNISTNLRSIVLLTGLVIPYLKKTKGNIVNVSSIAGENTLRDGGFGMATYCASKAGLNQFSQNCAMELAEYGIRVNVVSPGPVKTNFLQAAGFENGDYQDIADKSTALKLLTEPEEVAEIIAFLASDVKARTVTGSNYRVDAGYLVNGRRKSKHS